VNMGLCRGNRGNLMQHWTLAEVVSAIKDKVDNLHFVTTHSMAPWSVPEKKDENQRCRQVFRVASRRLKSQTNLSYYESAWKALSNESGVPYPSSAVFMTEFFGNKTLSISLCEFDSRTAAQIRGWLCDDSVSRIFSHHVLLEGDFRFSIRSPLTWNDVKKSDCIYIEMDPMKYDARRKLPPNHPKGEKIPKENRVSTDPQILYPEDIELILRELPSAPQPIILQVSSFDVNNGMTLERQEESLSTILAGGNFKLAGQTRVGKVMATFLFARNIDLQCDDLRKRFEEWLSDIEQPVSELPHFEN
jgi:hypothetical protein